MAHQHPDSTGPAHAGAAAAEPAAGHAGQVRVAVALNLVVALLLALLLAQSWRAETRELELRTTSMAHLAEASLSATLDKAALALDAAARQVERQLASGGIQHAGLRAMVRAETAAVPEMQYLGVFDARGVRICDPSGPPCDAIDIHDRDYFQQARATPDDTVRLSGPFLNKVDGQPALLMARATRGANGEFAGLVNAILPLQRLAALMQRVDVGHRGAWALRDLQLRLVVRKAGTGISTAADTDSHIADAVRERIARQPDAGNFRGPSSFDGQRREVAYRRLPRFPLTVLVGVAPEDTQGTWQLAAGGAAMLQLVLAAASVAVLRWRRAEAQRQAGLQQLLAQSTAGAAQLRQLYERTPTMLHAVTPAGALIAVSDAWLARLGYTRDAVMGRSSVDFFTAASGAEALQAHLPLLLQRGWQRDLPLQMVAQDGEVVDVLLSAILERDSAGRPLRIVAGLQDVTQRNRAEAALQANRRELASTVEALRKTTSLLNRTGHVAGVGGWELDLATQAITWSDETRLIHGVPPDHQPTLATAIAFYAPEARPVIEAAVAHGMQQGQGWDLELPFIRADGRRIWVRAQGEVEFETGTAGRRPVRLVGALQDITPRRAMEQDLRAKERFQRQVLDNVPGLIAHIDTQRRYTLVNQAYIAWDHRARPNIVGHTVSEVHGPAGDALLQPQLDRAFAGEAVHFEVDLPRGDEVRSVQVTYVPERDEAGTVVGVFSLKVDVTTLRQAEQQLRAVMEASPLGMFLSDAQGRCQYVNAAWQRITGQPRDASLGRGWHAPIHPGDRARVDAEWQAAGREGTPHRSDFRCQRADGQVVWVRGHFAPLALGPHRPAVVGTLEDVTAMQLLDQALAQKTAALKRSNEDLERFAYVASHDLQEPLRMVTSYGQLLARRHRAELSSDAQEFLDFMVDGGRRAQALIRDLLSLARLDSQARPWTAVPLDPLVDDVLLQLRRPLQASGAEVTRDALPTVTGDARQLGQLMTNLVSNALKFRDAAAPRIHIGAQRLDDAWRISVQDNGPGIDPKFHDRIFMMFQRLQPRGAHEGTGIGLAICKKVVERHGGRIGVSSRPGEGATFFFTLPDQAPGPPPVQDGAP